MVERIEKLEEQVAHLQKMCEDLSDVVARQEGEIAALTKRVEMLMTRAAEQELNVGGSVPLADQKPPHW